MRPNVTPQNNWAHLGIGACALLLPPLALGAALYSMLAAPDDVATRPAGAQAAMPGTPSGPSAPVAQPAGAEPVAGEPPVGKTAADVARVWDQVSAQSGPVPAPSNQIGSVQVAPAQINLAPVNPAQVTSTQLAVPQGAAVNPRAAAGAPPAVDGSPAVATPKRASRRHVRQQQEEYPLQNWIQQIGVLLRSSAGGS
jgi:hypothetical protein